MIQKKKGFNASTNASGFFKSNGQNKMIQDVTCTQPENVDFYDITEDPTNQGNTKGSYVLYACNNQKMQSLSFTNKILYIYHCNFDGCSSTGSGGGIYLKNVNKDIKNFKVKNIIIQSCTFINCNAQNGGAIYYEINNDVSPLNIIKCDFINNQATTEAGAISFNGCDCICEECTFKDNYAANYFILSSKKTLKHRW